MKIPLLHPDVVLLDVEMPEMDGVETLAAICKASPGIAVIMLSVSSEQGAAATLEALSLGAKDYLIKPEIAAILEDGMQKFSSELTARIDLLGTSAGDRTAASNSAPEATNGPKAIDALRARTPGRVDAVAIGISTGGPNALTDLLSGFPADFPVPILIVQHMPPVFTKLLAGRLAKTCKIRVAEGSSHQTIRQGGAWIAPGDFHMAVERDGETVRIRTQQSRPENSCRPAVDVLFRSVAKVYGPHALGVVMTGMGEDGFRGCQQIRAAGGQVLVQDEASSVVWGMPGAVARAGIADQIVPLRDLPEEISKRVWSHRPRKSALVGS
jgi:two-component system chemotaxis response regulator CheB